MKLALLQQKIRLCTAGVSQPCWQGSPYQPIPVAQQVPAAVALQIMENQGDYPGVSAQAQPVTHYVQPYATDAAQMLGYLQPITPQEVAQRHLPVTGFSGVDLVGQAGLEEQYDRQLRGTPGTQTLTVNAAGTVTGVPPNQASPKAGDTLVTSLNSQLQADTYNDLAHAIHSAQAEGNTGATTGAAVVMTTTGRVLAMASYPTYDPSIWNGGISNREFRGLFGTAHGEPILDRATQGEYGPGSTFKVTSASAAVADGLSAAGPYSCPGSVTIAGHTFNNWTTANLGPMSFHTALVWSCDTVFYQIAYQMYLHDKYGANFEVNTHAPMQKMQKMELAFGFGRNPGIDLPEQSPGSDPHPAVAVQLLEAVQELLVQARQRQRQLRPADRLRRLPDRVPVDPRPGRDRGDRPGLRDRHPAAARPGLRGDRQRRHPVQPAGRRGADLPDRARSSSGSSLRWWGTSGCRTGGSATSRTRWTTSSRAARPRVPSTGSRSARCRSRPRPGPPRSSAARPRRCSRRSRPPATPSTWSW